MEKRARIVLWFVVVFLLGVATRIYLEKYTYIFGFDSYWYARMASYVIRYGHVPEYDPIAFRGFPPVKIPWEISMHFPAWIYNVVYGTVYDKMKLLNVFKWLPAIFGGFGSVLVGILMLIVSNPFTAVLAGIFAATNPGYIYRTMSGFYEDDATSFFIPLAFVFAFLAYRAKDRKRFWVYTLLAGISLYLQAISWTGFYIVPYTATIFLALYVGYYLLSLLSDLFKVDKYADYVYPMISGILAVAAGAFFKYLAAKEAADALYVTGAVTSTTTFTLATSYFSMFFFGVFAAYMVYFLRTDERKYLYFALGSFVLAFLPYFSIAKNGFYTRVTLPGGVERQIGFGPTKVGLAILGSGLMILIAQLAGVFGTLLHLGREEKKMPDFRLLVIVFVPLAIAALSGPFGGFYWYSSAVNTLYHIFFPQSDVVETDSGALVRPYTGLIEPKTAGPMSSIIGEETYGFLNWPAKYGILFVIALVSIPFVFAHSLRDKRYLWLLAWIALGWYASWYKLKFAYYYGMPIAVASAVVLGDLYKRITEQKWRLAYLFILGVIVFSMVSTAVYHTVTRVPTLLTDSEAAEMRMFGGRSAEDYLEMFNWIEANTPEDANLLNWWDIGHWLTFFTERGVMTDNTNARIEADYEAARFYLSDENTAYAIAKKRHMNYVIYDMDFVWKARALAIYALETKRLDDPRLNDYVVASVNCSKAQSPYGGTVYLCTSGGSIIATIDQNKWAVIPYFAPGFYRPSGEAVKLRIGDREYVVYKLGEGDKVPLILLSPKVNDSVTIKMALNVPMEHFHRVWISKSGKLAIYKIE